MQNFISTNTIMIISLLCKKMPNLLNSIIQSSTVTKKPTLSARQIKEARLHPNTIVLQALTTAAIIQSALDSTNRKTEELSKQHAAIEKTLVDLISNEPKQGTTESPSNAIETLKQMLVGLKQTRKELESTKDNLQQELENLDEILPEQEKIWAQHRNRYIDQFIKELTEKNITLTEEEQTQLRNSGLTASNIKEQTENLEKLND